MAIVKWMFVGGIGLYVFFAFVMLRQIGVMNKAVETKGGGLVWLLGVIHFVFAVMVLLVAIMVH